MSNKEFQDMLMMMARLNTLLEKYSFYFEEEEEETLLNEPLKIPGDVYDMICEELDIDHIDLFGIS